jgi:D-glycero-D-manno-heptose 1,7-bisphosphate phosphatase
VRGLFLDRDGVINENLPDHVLHLSDLHFVPGSVDALAVVARTPFRVVVVTNQAAVGRGHLSLAELEAIHSHMLSCVRSAGGRIDAIYVCPHRPEEGCDCRKPGTAMLERAAAELGVELEGSYLIGDAGSDIRAALAVGCQPILVLTGRGRTEHGRLQEEHVGQHWVAGNLREAVDLMLTREYGYDNTLSVEDVDGCSRSRGARAALRVGGAPRIGEPGCAGT